MREVIHLCGPRLAKSSYAKLYTKLDRVDIFQCCTGILHFDTFQYSIFPPREYAERIREKYGEDYEAAAAFPSYMAIYYSIRTICEEQHLIKDNRDDLALLSSVFAALPRLKEVSLRCVEMADWVEESQLFLSTITNDNSYNHHFQVIAAALRAARDRCSYIETLEISGLHLPYYYGYRGLLRQITVKELLDGITTLRVHQCNESFLRLLSNCVHDISQLDLCCLCLDEDGLGIFRHLFQANWKSLRCIGFHDVTWYRPFGSERKKLTPDLLCNMLEAETQTGLWKRDDCSCLATRRDPEDVEGSWRLELGDSDGVPKLVLPLKRKFEDMAPY